ncbi:MAG: hypothetical protein QHH26_10045 [Armatimonadota bacterium]|nr:hypothetical protein [Armatimonadota bacterium]MDH7482296.1 hypothetical protein [Armatimonadota bacterium]
MAVDIHEFKRLLSKEFGKKLEHATPSNVRDFLDRMQLNVLGPKMKGPVVLQESASSYEEIIKDFFARVLDLPRDEALILLWLLAFDLSFSAIELQQAETFRSLFAEYEE